MSKTREIIKDAGDYSMATLLTQFVTVVAAILTRRFLGPAQMGFWALVQVILTYAYYSNLGTMDAIVREIPFYHGKNDIPKAEKIKNTTFSFCILTALIVSAGVISYAFLRRDYLSPMLFYGLLITAGLIFLQRINELLIRLVRAYKRFELAGKLTFYSAVVNMILIAILSYRYKLYGFMIAMALSFIFNIIYVVYYQNFHFQYTIDWTQLRELLVYGFPLMILSFFSTLFETIDKLMITRFLGLEALGLYGVALMAYGYLQSIPNAISIVVIPNLHEKFGRTENKHDLKSYLEKSDDVFSVVMPALIGLSWFLVPYLIEMILPKFIEGISALRILILGAYFAGVGTAYSLFIYVIKRHVVLFPLNVASCALAILFNWLAIQKGLGIVGVAGATTLAMLCYFTMIYVYTAWHVYGGFEAIQKYAVILFKFFWMISVLFLIKRWVRLPIPSVSTGFQMIVCGLCYLPFLAAVHKKYGLFSPILQRFLNIRKWRW